MSALDQSPPPFRNYHRRFLTLAALIFALLVLRRPDALTNPQFWAEDGTTFFYSQSVSGSWEALFTTYAGYLHLAPRLIAALASLFPVVFAPLIFNLCALAIASICCSMFFLPWYRHLLPSDVLRAALCLLIASAFYSDALVGVLTSVQWYLAVAALLVLVRPATLEARWPLWVALAEGFLVFIIGLSAPQTVVLVPFCAWKIAKSRGRARLAPAALTGAVLIQISIVAGQASQHVLHFESRPDELVAAALISFIYRVALCSVGGYKLPQIISAAKMGGGALIALLVVAVCLSWLWSHTPWSRRWRVAAGLYLIFGSIVLSLHSRSMTRMFLTLDQLPEWGGERYFYLACCVFAYLAAIGVERVFQRQGDGAKCLALILIFAGGAIASFRVGPLANLHWGESAAAVESWLRVTRSDIPNQGLSIPVNPSPWKIQLPGCSFGAPPPWLTEQLASKWEGQLVRPPGTLAEDVEGYVIRKGIKHRVANAAWATRHGYNWPHDVKTMCVQDLAAIPTGEDVR